MESEWEEVFATADDYKGTVIFNNLVSINTLTFPGLNSVAVKINFDTDPPTLWVNPDLAWDQAAKQFWNAAYRCMGKPALFPESEM